MTTSTSTFSTSSSGLASISGLSSGVDTTAYVKALMDVEARPQTRLKSKLVTNQAQTKLLQDLNAKLKTLTDSASKMSLGTTTGTMKVTTSDDKSLTASVTGSPVATTLSVQVVQTAKAASAEFTGAGGTTTTGGWVAPTPADGTYPMTIQANDKTVSLMAASYAIEDVAAAVNGSTTGVSAAIITDGATPPKKHLVLTAPTGAGTLDLKLTSGSTLTSATKVTSPVAAAETLGADAQVTVNGITKTSSSNTFADLVPGLSVTVAATVDTTKTFTVGTSRDATGASTAVKGVVEALASVLNDLKLATTAPASGTAASATAGGLFAGDSTMRSVYSSLVSTVVGAAGSGTTVGETLADVGIEATASGTVSVDAEKLTKLLTENPALAQKVLTNFGTQLSSAASLASITGSGSISAAISALQSNATDMTSRISAFDVRLGIRQKSLTAQFTAMETALSKLQNQTSTLTAALKQLDSNNS